MRLNHTRRFFRSIAFFAFVLTTAAGFVPVRGQEHISLNLRFMDFPGGLASNLFLPGVAGVPPLFPLANNGQGSNASSDSLTGDYNGDGNADMIVGSFVSDELAVFFGRGNGSFVRVGTVSPNAPDAINASFGRVTSMSNVFSFNSPLPGMSRVVAAVDYSGGPTADRILYLDISSNGGLSLSSFSPALVPSTVADPISVAVGSLDAGGFVDVAVLCSGASDGVNTGGFLAFDRGVDAVVDQRIGGGTNSAVPVVAEDAATQSGSLYDARNNIGGPSSNAYTFATDRPNRRLFRVTPLSETPGSFAPRSLAFGNSAHRDDGAVDLAFVANDFGSTGNGNSPAPGIGGVVVSAPPRPPEGAVFVLVNDQFSTGKILRNARRLDERYDFTNNPVTSTGQQDGVILRAGNGPAAVALGDFNADNRLDLTVTNARSGTISIYPSGRINDNNITTPFVGQTITSYVNPSFMPVGGFPTSVHVADMNGDLLVDIVGTNQESDGGFILFNSKANPGVFLPGEFIFPVGSAPGPSRSLSVGPSPVNGVAGPVNFNKGTLPDIVFARQGGGIAVRYGQGIQVDETKGNAVFGKINVSSFVGVAEGRINGDTLPDVVVCDRGADRILVAFNSPSGFNSVASVPTFINLGDLFPNIEQGGLSSVDVGNVDGKGLDDVVISVDGFNDQIIVLYNINGGLDDSDGRFTIRAFPVGGDPTAIKLADLAGPAGPGQGGATARDGAPEIVAVNRRSNSVTTLVNNGNGIFGQGRVSETGGFDPCSMALADFNDDGKIDAAVLNRGRRAAIADPNQSDSSQVGILLGNGDGSFQLSGPLIPVARGSVSIAAAGYGIVRGGVQIDIPDLNLDGVTDLAVAAQLGGGPTSDVLNPFTGNNEAGSLTLLEGNPKQPGQFKRTTSPEPLVDALGGGARLAVFPGAVDVFDGRVVGYGSLTLTGDYNQNGRPDAYVGGVERNNNLGVAQGLAAGLTSIDNLGSAFAAGRTFNILPSLASDSGTVNGRFPTDLDNVTGVVSSNSYVVSTTGTVVSLASNDLHPGGGQILPDLVQVTSIGRAYLSINVSSVLNHAPIVTTAGGLAAFTGPGRKVVLTEGEEYKLTLRATDIDPSAPGRLTFNALEFPNFVTMIDNKDGTASVTIKPGFSDGNSTANNGLGQAYDFRAEASDNDFRLSLTNLIYFRIFVKDKPGAPSIAPVSDQQVYAGQTATVPITVTDVGGRSVRLTTSFAAPFATFADNGDGTGAFTFQPTEADQSTHAVTVTALNDLGFTSSRSFKLDVVVNTAPVLEPVPDVTMDESEVRAFTVTVNDPDIERLGQHVRLSLKNGPNFVGLSDAGNGKWNLRLTPAKGEKGVFTVGLTAEDDGFPTKQAEATFRITVQAAVRVTSVVFDKKRLMVSGFGFGASPQLRINGTDVPAKFILPDTSDSSLTAKGSMKALGLRAGGNQIQVVGVDGRASNIYTVSLAVE